MRDMLLLPQWLHVGWFLNRVHQRGISDSQYFSLEYQEWLNRIQLKCRIIYYGVEEIKGETLIAIIVSYMNIKLYSNK